MRLSKYFVPIALALSLSAPAAIATDMELPKWEQARLDRILLYLEEKKYDRALNLLHQLAVLKSIVGQRMLGELYLKGNGVKKSYVDAYRWFAIAGKQGDDYSNYQAGRIRINGWGVPRDFEKAREHLEDSRDGNAYYLLGEMYLNGTGVEKSGEKALTFFKKAARKESIPALSSVGECYYRGIGIKRNPTVAEDWFLRADEHQDPKSQFYLAEMYKQGVGVPKDDGAARAYLDYWNDYVKKHKGKESEMDYFHAQDMKTFCDALSTGKPMNGRAVATGLGPTEKVDPAIYLEKEKEKKRMETVKEPVARTKNEIEKTVEKEKKAADEKPVLLKDLVEGKTKL